MPNPATRLITLIMLLQRQPNQKAADLAEELGVSIRSLHRYLGMLEEMGIPIYAERGPYGGYSLVRGYKMPPLVFSPEEAVAVTLGTSLVEEMWGEVYREAATAALAKLSSVLPDEQRAEIAWAQRSLVATGMNRANLGEISPHLETLRQAIHEGRRTRMVYRGSGQVEAQARELDPYALVHRWGWWYVIGFCHRRKEVRLFRVDRILELSLCGETYQPPRDFDVHAYLAAETQKQVLIPARLKFSPQAAGIAHENRSQWEQVEDQADGSVIVRAQYPDLVWAASMALSFGTLVEVLEPPELRRMVREWALAIAGQYTPNPEGE